MRKLTISLALMFAAALVLVRQASAQQRAEEGRSQRDATSKGLHTLDAEIVSVDTEKNTVTFRAGGTDKTEPAGVLSRYRLHDLKPGDKVVVTCKDVDGEHREIMAIRPARTDKAPAAKGEPAKN